MCRAQFKLDDIAEADIICHGRFRQHSGEPETDLDESVMDSNYLQGRGRGARGSRFVFYIATGGIEIYQVQKTRQL